jgi:hypothetical protein
MAAVLASDARVSAAQKSAIEVAAEFTLDEAGQTEAVLGALGAVTSMRIVR